MSKIKTAVIFSIVFFGVLFFTRSSLAATYYVSTTGNDSYNGLYETYQGGSDGPWKTLGKANSTVPSGNHTINIAAGAYAETITNSLSGSAPGYRWWKGASADTVSTKTFIIGGSYVKVTGINFIGTGSDDANSGAIQLSSSGSDHIVIDSCKFTECQRRGIGSHDNSTYITVNNCTFYHTKGWGINIWTSTSDHWTITNNDISRVITISNQCRGMDIKGSNHYIANNYIHDLVRSECGTGAHIDGMLFGGPNSPSYTGTIIEKNHVRFTEEAASAVASTYGFMISNGYGTIFRNNIVYAWGGMMIGGSGSPNGLVFYNNTFVRSSSWTTVKWAAGLAAWNGGSTYCYDCIFKNNIFVNYTSGQGSARSIAVSSAAPVVSDYNLFWADDGDSPNFTVNGGNISLATWQGTYGNDLNCKTTDPKFVTNYTDLHLQSTSPAINAGVTLSSVANDYDGIFRPQGSAYDIGAYEYVEATDTTPPSPPTGVAVN